MSEALKKMDAAFAVVADMDAAVEEFLANEHESGVVLKGADGPTVRDAIVALKNLCTTLAGALMDQATRKSSEMAFNKALEKALEEKVVPAEELKLPEGSLVAFGDRPNELSVIVLRKTTATLLKALVKAAALQLAGGTDDVLAVAGKAFPEMKIDNQVTGYKGAPVLGSVIVKKADSLGKLTKAARPEGEPTNLSAIEYIAKAGCKGQNRQVNLV